MNDTVNSTVAESTTVTVAPIALTNEQKITKIREQIAKLEAKIVAIETGKPEVKVAKVVALPAVGEDVSFFYGRRTATTEPILTKGTVVAVKPTTEVEGKRLPAQVKVQVGEGFDATFVTIYPAQIVVSFDDAIEAADEAAAE